MPVGVRPMLQSVAFAAMVMANYASIPQKTTDATHFDVIVVLGTPTNPDGTPSPEQRERVREGVREFRAGVAGHIIMTGGAAHNGFVEAHAMAMLAEAEGVPAEDVVEEGRAKDTIQNIYFSHEIMAGRNWRSAEVVSSPSHLPRAALILSHYDFAWRMHAARWPVDFTQVRIDKLYWGEAKGCWRLMRGGFPESQWLQGSGRQTTPAHK